MTPDAILRTDFTVWFDKNSMITLGDLLRYIEKHNIFFVPKYNKGLSRWQITTAYTTGLAIEVILQDYGVHYTKHDYQLAYDFKNMKYD